ncbi:hypothetical protein KIN20_024683 [Parelaphostrongylus tenuis]|uniref:Uncharacterized protein n=1 Tax=Parelaphostrongylus tenuis TaxID=148309 RepID=A0AAD5NA62_PARTN|nr:hypothetical protein KIN20_024683 [Parelaphostrongylus tenuis]
MDRELRQWITKGKNRLAVTSNLRLTNYDTAIYPIIPRAVLYLLQHSNRSCPIPPHTDSGNPSTQSLIRT